MRPLRIGVNALYLIPGGVGGTEIYLRRLLAALARIDPVNSYYRVHEPGDGARPCPRSVRTSTHAPQRVRAVFRARPYSVGTDARFPSRRSAGGWTSFSTPASPRPSFAAARR